MAHTPGPWSQNGSNLVEVVDRFACPIEMASYYIAMTPDRAVIDAEQEANARLIAAAPDLLEALEDAVAQVEATVPLDWKGMSLSYPNVKAWRAAIARARKG